MADYDVKAKLELDAKKLKKEAAKAAKAIKKIESELERTRNKGQAALNSLGSAFSGLGRSMRGSRLGLGRMVTGLVGIGVTYFGIRAVGGAIRDIAGYAGEANASVENLTLSLGTIMAEIEGISFGEAQTQAHGLYRQIQDIAIVSPGTAKEVADVFTMAYGPMRRAGQSMDDILRLSQNALSVAAAMRIDLPQVSRDISMMASGVAGTDVKTFRLLKSMGMITKTTKEWNEMALANPTAAAAELTRIFEQLGGPAAEAFGNTWAGVSSAFGDLVQNFARIFGGAAFERTKGALKSVNDFLLKYRRNLENVMEFLGEKVGNVFGRVFTKMGEVFIGITSNLDEFAIKIDTAIAKIKEFLPAFKKIAIGMAAGTIGMKILGTGLSVMGAALMGLSSLSGLGALGIGAAGAGGAAATAVGGAGAVAGGTGIGAALAAAGAALMTIVPIVLGVAGVFTVVGASIYAIFDDASEAVIALFEPIWGDLQEIGLNLMAFFGSVWELLGPIFGILGAGIVTLSGIILRLLVSAIRGASETLMWFGDAIEMAADAIGPPLQIAAEHIVLFGNEIANFLDGPFRTFARVFSSVGFTVTLPNYGAVERAPDGPVTGLISGVLDEARAAFDEVPESLRPSEEGTGVAPPGRPGTNVDMRGSRITVKQEFREADPDRIWMQFVDGLSREAVIRTQSGLLNPLTR